jgi:hypothetical protein
MTEAEILAEIASINTALEHIRKGGQSYTITSASGAGTSRTVTMADYKMLSEERDKLYRQLASLSGTRGYRMRPMW